MGKGAAIKAVQDTSKVEQGSPIRPLAEPSETSWISWFPSIVTFISLFALVLYFTGLGVALSVESNFGVPYAAVFSSGFDLLQLSVWGVSHLIIGSVEVFKDIGLYRKLFVSSWPLLITVIVFWGVLALLALLLPRKKDKVKREGQIKKWLRHLLFSNDSPRLFVLRGFVYSILATVAGPLLVLAAVLVTVFVASLMAVIPIMAMAAGNAHIREYVVGPEVCVPLANRSVRLQRYAQTETPKAPGEAAKKAANCIKSV